MTLFKDKYKSIYLIVLLLACFIAEFFLFRSRPGYEHFFNFLKFNFFKFSQENFATTGLAIFIIVIPCIIVLIKRFEFNLYFKELINQDFSFEKLILNKKVYLLIGSGSLLSLIFCIFFSEIYAFNLLNLLFMVSNMLIFIGVALSTNFFSLFKLLKKPPKSEVIFIFLLLGCFTLLVLPLINYIPYFVETDEGNVGNFSREFFLNKEIPLWGNLSGALPSLSFFIGYLSLLLTSNTLWGLRFSSYLVALISLLIYYLAVRVSFNKQTAAISSIILACSAYFIGFSRTGYNNIDSILIYTIVFASFMLAFKFRNLFFIFMAGFASFSSLYLYVGTRISIIISLAFILLAFIFKQVNFKTFIRMLLSFLLGGVIIAAPYITNIIKNYEPSVSRAQSIFYLTSDSVLQHMKESYKTNSTINVVVNSFRDSVLGLTYISAKTSTSNILGRPVLDFFASIFFIIGFIYAITRIKDIRILFILISFTILLIAISLAIDAPTIHRVIVFFPVLSLIVALGLIIISKEISNFFSSELNKKMSFSILSSIFLLCICLSNIEVYFLNYVINRSYYSMYEKKSIISNLVNQYQNKFDIYFVYNDFEKDFYEDSNIINLKEPASIFLTNNINKTHIINIKNNRQNLKINQKVDKDVIFLVDNKFIEYVNIILNKYDISNFLLVSNPKDKPLFCIIKVQKNEVNKVSGEK